LSTDVVTVGPIPLVAGQIFWGSRRHANEDGPVP
jgi:hypothetical protein